MEHTRDIELIELAAGGLEAQREKAVLVHLQSCPRCCAKLVEIRKTWDVLGAWQAQPRQHLDSERIGALVAEAAQSQVSDQTVRLPRAGMLLRLAASIAVAALVGYAGGQWSIAAGRASLPPESPSYVSALGLEIGESLSTLVFEGDPANGEGR